jgi:hypothetical protein
MSAPQPIDQLVTDPHWFPEDMGATGGTIALTRVERAELAAQSFLGDGHWDTRAHKHCEIPIAAALARLSGPHSRPATNFIWHTGFCGSTLISRAIDRPGRNLSLREPAVLLTLARIKRAGEIGAGRRYPDRFAELVFQLLSRPFEPDEAITIKPTNTCNYLLRDAAAGTSGKMLVVYSDCRSFVESIIKKREYGRHYVRRLFSEILGDGNDIARWSFPALFALSDLRVAALAWHMQIAEFHRSWPLIAGRAVSLDCDAFYADPLSSLSKLNAFLELGLDDEDLRGHVEGALFRQHAKAPEQQFEHRDRIAEHEEVRRSLGQELDDVVRWSYEICRNTPKGPPLPNPIVDIEKSYL